MWVMRGLVRALLRCGIRNISDRAQRLAGTGTTSLANNADLRIDEHNSEGRVAQTGKDLLIDQRSLFQPHMPLADASPFQLCTSALSWIQSGL